VKIGVSSTQQRESTFIGVIPAKAGMRRQDAEANAAGGPKGRLRMQSVIHWLSVYRARHFQWMPALAGTTA